MSSDFTLEQIGLMQRACLLCDRSSLDVRTGCLIVVGGVVVGEGWNVDLSSVEGCAEGDAAVVADAVESSGSTIIHAERLALGAASSQEVSLEGSAVYATRFPCEECAHVLVGAGVSQVFYMSDHFTSGNAALSIFEDAGVRVSQIPEEVVWRDY